MSVLKTSRPLHELFLLIGEYTTNDLLHFFYEFIIYQRDNKKSVLSATFLKLLRSNM